MYVGTAASKSSNWCPSLSEGQAIEEGNTRDAVLLVLGMTPASSLMNNTFAS